MNTTRTGLTDVYVFVGTYTERLSFVAGKAEGIYVYRLNLASGALSHIATYAGAINPSFLALSPSGDRLYAVNELTEEIAPSGMVSAFAIDPATKHLTFLNQQSTHGFAPCYVSVHGSGTYAFVANYLTGNLCVLPIGDNGALGPATDVIQHHGSGPTARQEGPHAHSITPDPSNRWVYALDLGIDRILIYRLDPSKGKLLPADPSSVQVSPGSGPRHLAFHPHGGFAYAINELNSTITVFAFDDATGALEERSTVSTLPRDYSEPNTCADIHVAPSGRFVYGSNRGHDSIAIFAVDTETGELSLVGHEPTQGATPRNFAIDPTGAFLLAANQDSDTIVSFRIDNATGELTQIGLATEVPTPVCLRML